VENMGKKYKTKNGPVQRDSGNSNLGVLRILRILGSKTKSKTTPAQRDSEISKLGVLGILGEQQRMKTSPAQQDSGIYNLVTGRTSQTRPTGLTEPQRSPAQRDSGISILKTSPYRPCLLAVRLVPQSGDPYRPLFFKNRPAQRHSKMSNGRLSGVLCWPHGQKGIFTMQIENKTVFLTCGWDYKKQNAPAQRHSKMSNMKIITENSLLQGHSKMSNGQLSGVLCLPHGQKGIPTMQIKNTVRWFMSGWEMSR